MSDRWIKLREGLLDLTPLSDDENLAALCNGNYWVVCYDARGIRVFNGEGEFKTNLSQAESFSDPRVVSRAFWCPHCMKTTPLNSPTEINRHIATAYDSPRTFREVLETRPGYFEELYFRYPEAYLEYKEQAEYWIKYQSLETKRRLNMI